MTTPSPAPSTDPSAHAATSPAPAATPLGNPWGMISLVAGCLVLVVSVLSQSILPLTPLLASERGIPHGLVVAATTLPGIALALAAVVTGVRAGSTFVL